MSATATRRFLALSVSTLLLLVAAVAAALPTPTFAQAVACADGLDNDGDGRIDYPTDKDCTSLLDDLEHPSRIDVTVTLTDGVDFAKNGDELTYLLTITNNVNEAVTVPVTVGISNLSYLVDIPTDAESIDTRSFQYRNLPLGALENKKIFFVAKVVDRAPPSSFLVANATVANVNGTDSTALSRGGIAPAELSVVMNTDQTTVAPNGLINYTVFIRNTSPTTAVGKNIAASVPLFGEFVDSPTGVWDGGNVRWNGTDIPGNSTLTLRYQIRVRSDATDGKIIMASAFVDGKQDSALTTVSRNATAPAVNAPPPPPNNPPPTVSNRVVFRKVADRSETVPNGLVNYTILVRNNSTVAVAGLVVTDTFNPDHFSVEPGSTAEVIGDSQLQWTLPALAPGETWKKTFALRTKRMVKHADILPATAQLTGGNIAAFMSSAQRMQTVEVGVLRQMPQTGLAFDLFLILVGFGFALSAVLAQRRRTQM